jgi:peptidoglycan/LPS O-acetylase OafA/YrhL
VLICPIIRIIEFHYDPGGAAERTFESTADALACGCLLALLDPRLRSNRLYARLQTYKGFFLIPAAVLVAAAQSTHPHLSLLICSTVENVGIALCIHRVVLRPHGIVGQVLNARPVAWLGRISYSLYLWQQLFLDRYTASPLTTFPLNIVLAFAAAIASYQLIELPALRFRARLDRALFGDRPVVLKPPKPPVTATSSS